MAKDKGDLGGGLDALESEAVQSPAEAAAAEAARKKKAPKAEEAAAKAVPLKIPEAGCSAAFVVTALKRVSVGAQTVVMKPGKVISDALYGPGFIERMRKAGLEMHPKE